jgi:F-type H+-transporting ATPase subunit delta
LHFKGLRFSTGRARETAYKPRARGVKGEGTIVSGMAGRYATALFELALSEKAIDQVTADLDRFDALVADNPDLMRLVRSPVFSADEQLKALSAVLERAGIAGVAAQFLKVAAANRRLFAVRVMIKGFRALVSHYKGEIRADVTLAEKPNDRQLAAIKAALGAVTRKDVQVDIKVDPSLIGGLIVKLGSRMVDSSLRTKLNSIKHAMKEVS